MVAWPASLPQEPLARGYDERLPETRLRTQVDAGPAKVRRRFSAGVRPFSVQFVMTAAQVSTLDAFYITTLEGGALAFDFDHPRTGASLSFRFVSPPEMGDLSHDLYSVSAEIEALP